MQKFIDDLSEKMFGLAKSEAIRQGVCVICKKDALNFRDLSSAKEYLISGLCQECQDNLFEV